LVAKAVSFVDYAVERPRSQPWNGRRRMRMSGKRIRTRIKSKSRIKIRIDFTAAKSPTITRLKLP